MVKIIYYVFDGIEKMLFPRPERHKRICIKCVRAKRIKLGNEGMIEDMVWVAQDARKAADDVNEVYLNEQKKEQAVGEHA